MVPRWLVKVLHPPQKFVRPPFWNSWRYGIEKYGVEVIFNRMTSLLNFIKIYQLVQKLLGGDTQTDRQTGDIISLTFLFKESRLKKRWHVRFFVKFCKGAVRQFWLNCSLKGSKPLYFIYMLSIYVLNYQLVLISTYDSTLERLSFLISWMKKHRWGRWSSSGFWRRVDSPVDSQKIIIILTAVKTSDLILMSSSASPLLCTRFSTSAGKRMLFFLARETSQQAISASPAVRHPQIFYHFLKSIPMRWDLLMVLTVDVCRRFRDACCLHHQRLIALMMKVASTSRTLVNF
jgi:hypothetical protein